MKGDAREEEGMGRVRRSERRLPSLFFEEMLHQMQEHVTRLTAKVENCKYPDENDDSQ